MPALRIVALVAVFCLLRTAAFSAAWDFATPYPEGDFRTSSAKAFAEAVRGATSGALNLVVFPGGSLLPESQIEPALRQNRIPIGLFDLSTAAAGPRRVLAFSSLPFLAPTYADALRLWNAARAVVQRHFADGGMLVLYALPSPPAALLSAREVTQVSDLQAAPIVVDDPWLDRLVTHIGARPVALKGADPEHVFADRAAAMLAPPEVAADIRAWTFAHAAYDVQASFPLCVVVVNQQAFGALDEPSQRAVLNAAVTAQNNAWGASIDQRNSGVATLEANRLVVQSPPPALMEAFGRAGRAIVAEWRDTGGAEARRILNDFGWTPQ